MRPNAWTSFRDFLQAQFCYLMFITPLHFPLEKKYREFAKMACEFMDMKRHKLIHEEYPRPYVLHHFLSKSPSPTPHKKILITHGWMSRAAYMVRLIKALHHEGYEVYALDFPAHGESKGIQLHWIDAVAIIKHTLNTYGPFYGIIGHSFGGSMLLNALNLAGQFTDWQLDHKPERAVLIASPTQMRFPVKALARRFKLTGAAYLHFRQLIYQQAAINIKHIGLRQFIAQKPQTHFLCIHGEEDATVHPKQSIDFCLQYKSAELSLLARADHVSVLMDERVERRICDFLASYKS